METGEEIFVDASLLPQFEYDKDIEIDDDTLRKAQVVPVGPDGLTVSISPNQESKNEYKEPVEYIGNSPKGRGDNWAGGLRNVAQGLGMGVGDEAEAAFRAYIYPRNKPYGEYLKNARESYKGYSAMHPSRAVGLQVAGSLLPSLLTFGATAPASAVTTGGMMGRGLATGLGLGATQGFLSEEGDKRLLGAGLGGTIGGFAGGLTPGVIKGGQHLLKWGSQVKKGMGKEIGKEEATNKIINLVSGANENDVDNAYILGMASAKGETGVKKAAKDINILKERAIKAEQQGYSAEKAIPKYGEILEKLKTPQMKAADQEYANFAANNFVDGNATGGIINNILKKYPAARKAYENFGKIKPNAKDIKLYDDFGNEINLYFNPKEIGSFEGMRDVSSVLRKQINRHERAGNVSTADELINARKEIMQVREQTTPGVSKIDKKWSDARNQQDVFDDRFFKNVEGIEKPKELLPPTASVSEVLRSAFPARVRGIGRELMETGQVAPSGVGKTNARVQKAFKPIENIGVKIGGKTYKIGEVPTTRAGQAINTDYWLDLQNTE